MIGVGFAIPQFCFCFRISNTECAYPQYLATGLNSPAVVNGSKVIFRVIPNEKAVLDFSVHVKSWCIYRPVVLGAYFAEPVEERLE